MLKDLTFSEVCKFLKKDDGSLIDATDKLLGVSILLTSIAIGPAALPALGLLRAKDELTRICRSILEKVTAKKETDFVAHSLRMQITYGLICFTAFFEALDKLMPQDIRKKIDLQPSEKRLLSKRGTNHVVTANGKHQDAITSRIPTASELPLPFPHPVSTYDEQITLLKQLYSHMTKGFQEFVQKLSISDEKDELTLRQVHAIIEKLPGEAIACFEAQYFALARQYQEFYIWSQLQEHKSARNQMAVLDDHVKLQAALAAEANQKIDVGFRQLRTVVDAMPERFAAVESANVVEGLKRYYEARVNEPIIEDKYEPEPGKPALNFPKISEAFVPQSFCAIRYISKDNHLEREDEWRNTHARKDLGAFLLGYLSSPYSIETPLLVLGHPGSGKSLLTKIVCANLISQMYTPIRVPLREVDADSPIESQIEDLINRITGNRISSWANFSGQFHERPLVIILDGYDELLQASGKVFAGYLKSVQQFQQREFEQERPVRVIVTSRIALIDKATIPLGTTVLRLLPFDDGQKGAWIEIWNGANSEYFKASVPQVKPFEIPDERRIAELAEQPLLLLMLALYDSEGNSLRERTSIDRTILYDSLLRRFVKRELQKSKEFENKAVKDQQEQIDREMNRLGVAAIGMYNRRRLHIQATELDGDLGFFELERSLKTQDGRSMTQAELLLGSFFFIHKSKSSGKEAMRDHAEYDAAFEFLHNTFGEFLTADFILRYAFQETTTISTLKQNENLRAELQAKLSKPDGLAKGWFACLMYAPLYSRPVVIEMLREWTNHQLQRRSQSREDFLASLDDILRSQFGMILTAKKLPPIMTTDDARRFADLPLLNHVATYSLNLVIIRTILDKNDYIFDEQSFASSETDTDPEAKGARPWDKLAHIWRSCFTLDNLSGLTAVFSAKRDDSRIILASPRGTQIGPSRDRLETVQNVAYSLADNITAGLAGLLAIDPGDNRWREIGEVEKKLDAENIHLHLEFIVRRLRQALLSEEIKVKQVSNLIGDGLEAIFEGRQRTLLLDEFFDLAAKASREGQLRLSTRPIIERLERFWHPRMMLDMIETQPTIATRWLRFISEIGGDQWLERFDPRYFERYLDPRTLMEMLERQPRLALDWLRLFGKAGYMRLLERIEPHYLERLLQPRFFLEIIERQPELSTHALRVLYEIGGDPWLARLNEEFFSQPPAHRLLEGLMERSEAMVLSWFKAMHEIGGTQWFAHLDPRFLERFANPRFLSEMLESQPELASDWLSVIYEIGDERLTAQLDDSFFEQAFHPSILERMINANPAKAVEWIRLLRKLGAERRMQSKGIVPRFERYLDPRFLVSMLERNPKAALMWVHELRTLVGDQRLHEVAPEFARMILRSGRFANQIRIEPELAFNLIRFLRELGGRALPDLVKYDPLRRTVRQIINQVPLEYIRDVKWYARITRDRSLIQQIDSQL